MLVSRSTCIQPLFSKRKDLISPEDLFRACQYIETLDVSIELKRFKSGLLVLQEKSKSEEKRIHQLVLWIQTSSRGVSIFEVADRFHWSMGIAYETLKVSLITIYTKA